MIVLCGNPYTNACGGDILSQITTQTWRFSVRILQFVVNLPYKTLYLGVCFPHASNFFHFRSSYRANVCSFLAFWCIWRISGSWTSTVRYQGTGSNPVPIKWFLVPIRFGPWKPDIQFLQCFNILRRYFWLIEILRNILRILWSAQWSDCMFHSCFKKRIYKCNICLN